YGGALTSNGHINFAELLYYNFLARLSAVDLHALDEVLTKSGDPSKKASGRGDAMMKLSGLGSDPTHRLLDRLSGVGEFRIRDSAFLRIPAINEIGKASGVGDVGTVGQAAGALSIDKRVVEFKKLIVYSPALGIQGTGRADFDGNLDFQAVAAPLANWKQQLQKTKIPLLDDVGAE